MRIALAQMNPVVGDIAGNTRLVLNAIRSATDDGAELLICSELAIIGYPPRDLLLRDGVVESCTRAIQDVARSTGDIIAIIGHPRREPNGVRGLRNSVSVCHRGDVIYTCDKRLLPGYDVFDEDRYFDCGHVPGMIQIGDLRLGILCCEDLWRAADSSTGDPHYPLDPVSELASLHPNVVAVLNASPFEVGKGARHFNLLRHAAQRFGCTLASVNQFGANDDLIFDGRSVILNAQGNIIASMPEWQTGIHTFDTNCVQLHPAPVFDETEELVQALVLGVRDYVHKTGCNKTIVGLSGGIDSALTATIAAFAIGPANVIGVMMPSRYSSPGSIDDSKSLSRNLQIGELLEIPIFRAHETMQESLLPILADRLEGLADENLQSRLRGVLLMAISNAMPGALVLATGNKSELATGYSTLYGDMCGAVSVVGDLTKKQVYAAARWINEHPEKFGLRCPPIPESTLTKPPSAELRPDQTDQDTLPPYDILDEIVDRYIDREESVHCIARSMPGHEEIVRRFTAVIDRAQYKREQAAVILKVSPRTFGRGRQYPIVMRDTSVGDGC